MPDLLFPTLQLSSPPLADLLEAIDRAPDAAARLQRAADAIVGLGFDAAHVVMRGSGCAPLGSAVAGTVAPASAPDGLSPLPGIVWRRRLAAAEHFRGADGLYLLDGADPWTARELWGADDGGEPDETHDPATWHPRDVLLAIAEDRHGAIRATLAAWRATDGRRPGPVRREAVALLARQLGGALAFDELAGVSKRRGARLQRLQEVGAALARSLDEREIVDELARQAVRATDADGVLVSVPDLAHGTMRPLVRVVRGRAHPLPGELPLGDGLVHAAARRGAPVFLDALGDAAEPAGETDDALPPSIALPDVLPEVGPAGSALAVPLLVANRLVAVLAVHHIEVGRFDAEDADVLSTMASQAATAIANARRYAESERARRQTEALADVARAVSESLRPGEVMRLILRHAVALLEAEGACIALREGAWMRVVAGIGAAELLPGVHLPIEASLVGRVVSTGRRLVENALDVREATHPSVSRIARLSRAVIAPLVTPRETFGVVAVVNRAGPFTDDDASVLQRLADQVAVALANARLFEEVERATREWKGALDAMPSGLVVLDPERRIVRCNRAMVGLSGLSAIPELLGAEFPAVLTGTAQAAVQVAALLHEAHVAGEPLRSVLEVPEHGRAYDLGVSPQPNGGSVITVTPR